MNETQIVILAALLIGVAILQIATLYGVSRIRTRLRNQRK